MIYKTGDRVYDYRHGWGVVSYIGEPILYPVEVKFQYLNKYGVIFKDGIWAENLEAPKLKEGQGIWVRDKPDAPWVRTDYKVYENEGYDTLDCWEEYSIPNPYPDSIEARAIELLKLIGSQIDSQSFVMASARRKISEFIEEIESHDRSRTY